MSVPAAFPYIDVRIDTSALQPVAQRAPGVVAVVGTTPNGANGGEADQNKPFRVDTKDDVLRLFANASNVDGDGNTIPTPLYSSLLLAMRQDPKPSKIYGVRVEDTKYADALSGLEAADDVTFVSLANEARVGAGTGNGTFLRALKKHVEDMSAQGQKRVGVAMIDPKRDKDATYVDDAEDAVKNLRSDSSRMVMVAARGSTEDSATAAMAAIAGFPPHVSIVLKKIRGLGMPIEEQYGPSEIIGLSEKGIVPIVDPDLIVGTSLHFAEGRCFTSDASLLYIDIVRTLDDIEFRLRAGLIGLVGDARITKGGMTRLKTQVEGILGPLKRRQVITEFSVAIPVLDALSIPESARTPTDNNIITTARANRTVDMIVSVTYGPATHRLRVTLAPKF